MSVWGVNQGEGRAVIKNKRHLFGQKVAAPETQIIQVSTKNCAPGENEERQGLYRQKPQSVILSFLQMKDWTACGLGYQGFLSLNMEPEG